MDNVIIWSKYHCPHCDQAKNLLTQKGINFEERKIGDGWTREDLLEILPTARSVPQIFFGAEHVGGVEQLKKKLGGM